MLKRFLKWWNTPSDIFYHPEHDMWFRGTLDEAIKLDLKREQDENSNS